MEHKFFYANASEMGVSIFDVSIRFVRQGWETTNPSGVSGRTGETGDAKAVAVEAVTISLAPAQAKSLAVNLFKAIRDYEAKNGRIPVEVPQQKDFDVTFGPLLKAASAR